MDDKIVSQASSSTALAENSAVEAVPVSDDEEEQNNGIENEQEVVESNQENVVFQFFSDDSPKEIDHINVGSPKEIEPEAISPNEPADSSLTKITNGNGILNNNYGIKSPSPTEITPPPSVETPPTQNNESLQIDEYSISDEMHQYILINNINFGELDTINDLWQICDAVSAAHSGLPDSLLKEAFLLVLQRHIQQTTQNYARQHLQLLIRMWKKEVQSEKPSKRPSKFIAASAEYSPPIYKKKRSNAEKKRTLKSLMSVGEVLQQAQLRFATEEGELDVEEDQHGNISIGGCELTFETWGQLNKIKDSDVVQSKIIPPKRKRKRIAKAPMPTVVQNVVVPPVEQPVVVQEAPPIEKKPEPEPKPEKDEGELSESDDSDSCSSSASEDNSDDGKGATSRGKRQKRRHHERQQGGASSVSNMTQMFNKIYQYRFQICQALTIQQKSTFMNIIKQGNGTYNSQQMTQFMTSIFGNSAFGASK